MNEIWDIRNSQEIDRLLRECDDASMEMPHIEANPHLLISKVRKHYLDYVIKLLSVNYEKKQKLLGKNIYLPSAIWRCAKHIELNAAQACMVVDLYRKNIIAVIKLLKTETRRGKLNRQLLECLQTRPENEKNVQVNLGPNKKDCNCKCTCNGTFRKKQKSQTKQSNETSFTYIQNQMYNATVNSYSDPFDNISMSDEMQYHIPVITNTKDCPINPIPATKLTMQPPQQTMPQSTMQLPQPSMELPQPNMQLPQSTMQLPHPTMQMPKPTVQSINLNQSSKVEGQRLSIESQDSEDQVMLQLEQLFRDSNDPEEDIFDGGLCDIDFGYDEQEKTKMLQESLETTNDVVEASVMDSQAAKLKSIDERLALLESAGILNVAVTNKSESKKDCNESPVKERRTSQNKWLCEQYFQKRFLFNKMDEIRDTSRKKHIRIKRKFLELFGEDSDDEEDVMSPLEETPEFVLSCKERIAPWIVKTLTPYYVKGRIRGKALFKTLASHLIRFIYRCNHYPSRYDVNSFVSDFLKSHKLIRCEADFKDVSIEIV